MYLLLIIIIIILLVGNNDLRNENIRLKKEKNTPSNNINFCPNCGYDLNNKRVPATKVTPPEDKIIIEENKVKKPKKKIDSTELKNSTILIVGAILIVISAIVFLTTTWNTSLDIIKTIIVLLMFFVFLGFSHIADKYLHIKETSKVFFYISLSYLPLVFVSISLFKLFGEYLSINGEGRYIYLAASSTIMTLIYYYIMKKKEDLFTTIGGIIFQIISISLFVLIFTNNIKIILISLLVHQLIYLILYINKKYYLNESFHKKFNDIYMVILFIVNIFFAMSYGLFEIDFYLVGILVLYYIICYVYLLAINKRQQEFNCIGPIIITLIFMSIANTYNKGLIIYQLLTLLNIAIIYLIDYLKDNKIKEESFIITSTNLIIIYILSIVKTTIIPSYAIMFIYSIFFIINSAFLKNKDLLQKAISIPIFVFIIDLVLTLKIEILIIPVLSILTLLLSNLINIKNKNIKETLPYTSIIYSIIGNLIILPTYIHNYNILLLLSLFYVLIYLYIGLLKDNYIYRIISYIYILIMTLICRFMLIDHVEIIYYIVPISILIINIIEFFKKPNDKYTPIFKDIMFIISYIVLIYNKDTINIIVYIILTCLFIKNIKDNKYKEDFYYLPFASYLAFAYSNKVEIVLYTSFLLVTLLLVLVYQKKNIRYIIMSIVLSLIIIFRFELNKYFAILFLLFDIIIFYLSDKKYKDLYLAAMYILIALLIRFVLYDTDLYGYTVLTMGNYTILTILLSRTIIKKHSTDYKLFEYSVLSIINIMAIMRYPMEVNEELNGMLFVFFLLILTIVGYMKKWGPIALTSLLFILINTFILTRMFWLSLPWWIYLLLVGSILISFAVRNEIKEKDKNKNIIKDIAKKIDL